jgi:hypothetical protein
MSIGTCHYQPQAATYVGGIDVHNGEEQNQTHQKEETKTPLFFSDFQKLSHRASYMISSVSSLFQTNKNKQRKE